MMLPMNRTLLPLFTAIPPLSARTATVRVSPGADATAVLH